MSEVFIRTATEQDLPAILRLYQEARINGEGGFTVEEAVAHFALLKSYPSFRVFIAIVGKAVVGTYELVILDNMAKRGRKSGVRVKVSCWWSYRDKRQQQVRPNAGRAPLRGVLDAARG